MVLVKSSSREVAGQDAAGTQVPRRDGCLAKIRSRLPSLSKADKKVAVFVLSHPELFLMLPVRDLAPKCRTSEASIVRFCQTMGYRGIPEMRGSLIPDLLSQSRTLYQEVQPSDSTRQVIEKLIHASVCALQDTQALLSPESLDKAARAILKAKALFLFGTGGSSYIAQNAAQKFLRLGIRTYAFVDAFTQAASVTVLSSKDVAIGLSYSGETEGTVNLLKAARDKGCVTVAITNFDKSLLTHVADITLLTASVPSYIGSHAGPHRITQIFILDLLATVMAIHQH